jgi:RNA-directed DNA polymerase
MVNRKAPRKNQKEIDPESETWNKLPWRKFEQHVYRIQKRIFRASQHGNTRAVQKLQKLLMKSEAAKLLAVRRVTQDNQGKKTAGVDGVKAVPPKQRFVMAHQVHPARWKFHKVKPARRIHIPKPGKTETRPLGIPTMYERARQALAKLALEPEWEAQFEPNSYGFRPGRSCQDAIEAIFKSIKQKAKYVLDADVKGCFDNISHSALLEKLRTYPTMKQAIKAWLKAGALDEGVFTPTEMGTPQGGVISPLLANIALHGLEEAVKQAYTRKEEIPQIIRYADDFVVLHPTEAGVIKAKTIIEGWLKDMGLELKPSKTRISHTLLPYQGNVGFDFLGFTVRQFPVGKTHTGKNPHGKALGFKTIISPSKEAIKRHTVKMRELIQSAKAAPQGKLIKDLNPVTRGWANYYRTQASRAAFERCDNILHWQLWRWAKYRHKDKASQWIKGKYWKTEETCGWVFRDQEGHTLRMHRWTPIQRYVKVQGMASPYDGNLLYWAKRLKNHPMLNGELGKLLAKQQGKCRWCELLFQDGDLIEIDHLTPKSEGGGEELSNKFALHRHCHDQRHEKYARTGIKDNDHMTEEPNEGKAFTFGSEDESFS